MPFTLAHPVAALPLRRRLGRFGSTPGLAIGAMTPDLAYFLPLGVSGPHSHSLAGLFWFCLPAGVVAWIAYEWLARPFAVALAPASIASRLGSGPAAVWSGTRLRAAVVSVLVAASTHIAWDSFTHGTGTAVQAVEILRHRVSIVPGYAPFVFTLLQHVSTLLGLSILAYWGVLWFRRTQPLRSVGAAGLPTWIQAVGITALLVPSAVAGCLVLWARLRLGEAPFPVLQNNLGRAIFSAGTVFLTGFMASALAWRAWHAGLSRRRAAGQVADR